VFETIFHVTRVCVEFDFAAHLIFSFAANFASKLRISFETAKLNFTLTLQNT